MYYSYDSVCKNDSIFCNTWTEPLLYDYRTYILHKLACAEQNVYIDFVPMHPIHQ